MNGTRAKKMKPRAGSREKSAGGREVVRISSCPAFDAYLSANKWPVDQQKSKEMFARLGEQMRDRCEREVRQLAHLSIIKQDAFADHPSLNRMAKRIRHALNFRLKKMAANVSSRKRLRGESEKEKIANLLKDAAIRLFVSKQHLPVYLLNNTDVEFSRRVAAAHVKGVNPLFDHVDWTILFCWDQLSIRFLPGQFVGYAYVDKGVPGLNTWRDAAAALFIAFVENDETFYSRAARPSKEHPNRRPHGRYKARRKELDLHPHKRAVITRAAWNRSRDVLHVESKADGWGWEIYRFNPHAPQIN